MPELKKVRVGLAHFFCKAKSELLCCSVCVAILWFILMASLLVSGAGFPLVWCSAAYIRIADCQ